MNKQVFPHSTAEATLADRVTETLAGQLRSGVYPVNSRLPTEKSLAEKFGVSRTVVREAISRLKSEGLVETRQGSGTDPETGLHMGDYFADFVDEEARALGLSLADLRTWTPPAPVRRARRKREAA